MPAEEVENLETDQRGLWQGETDGGSNCGGKVEPVRPREWWLSPRFFAFIIAVVGLPGAKSTLAGTSCAPSSIGLDTTRTIGFFDAKQGEAMGQSFLARDTLINSVTIWRVPQDPINFVGIHLYIIGTDANRHPVVNNVVVNGPVVTNPYGDGVHPTPYVFTFDPPCTLPGPGYYCLAFRLTYCNGYYDIAGAADDYPDGQAWWFRRSECYLRPSPTSFPDNDLVFTVEFCDATTPVHADSWGKLKTLYR